MNFKNHLTSGIAMSVFISPVGYVCFNSEIVLIGSIACIICSILPDIDHSKSIANKVLFILCSFISMIILIIVGRDFFNWFIGVSFGLGGFLMIYYGIRFVFNKIVIHRGIWHSSFMAIFIGYILHVLLQPHGFEVIGFFATIGYFLHLILDEVYSIFNLKKSFGTALKFF